MAPAGCMPGARPRAGFAFLYALLLVALLGLSLLVASEVDSTLRRREQEAALLQIGQEFRQALQRYRLLHQRGGSDAAPLQLDDLVQDRAAARMVRHLRRIYRDPFTGQAEWGLVRLRGRIVGVHSLATGQPLKQDGFEADDAAFKGAASYRDWVFTVPADAAAEAAAAASAASAPAGAASGPAAGFGAVPVPLPPTVKP